MKADVCQAIFQYRISYYIRQVHRVQLFMRTSLCECAYERLVVGNVARNGHRCPALIGRALSKDPIGYLQLAFGAGAAHLDSLETVHQIYDLSVQLFGENELFNGAIIDVRHPFYDVDGRHPFSSLIVL